MAMINNYYVWVKDETFKRGVSVSKHPVEKGLDITDNVKREPVTISIKGEIVGSNAKQVMDKITALHQSGKYVKYIGRNILSNAIIEDFETDHPNTIWGGCSFTMTIREIRVAKSPLVVRRTSVKKQVKAASTTKRTYTVKKGDTLWAIAKKYYGSGAKYPTIVNANKNLIKDPNLIHIGWVLTIP